MQKHPQELVTLFGFRSEKTKKTKKTKKNYEKLCKKHETDQQNAKTKIRCGGGVDVVGDPIGCCQNKNVLVV
jgi:hypothetical protein